MQERRQIAVALHRVDWSLLVRLREMAKYWFQTGHRDMQCIRLYVHRHTREGCKMLVRSFSCIPKVLELIKQSTAPSVLQDLEAKKRSLGQMPEIGLPQPPLHFGFGNCVVWSPITTSGQRLATDDVEVQNARTITRKKKSTQYRFFFF